MKHQQHSPMRMNFIFENKELQRTNSIIVALDKIQMTLQMKNNLNDEFSSINNELENMKNDLEMQLIKASSSTEQATTYSDITKRAGLVPNDI